MCGTGARANKKIKSKNDKVSRRTRHEALARTPLKERARSGGSKNLSSIDAALTDAAVTGARSQSSPSFERGFGTSTFDA